MSQYDDRLIADVLELWDEGFSVRAIAEECSCLPSAVDDIVAKYYGTEDWTGDDMDGDHGSALASAGWGTDEDYIMDNDYMDSYDL